MQIGFMGLLALLLITLKLTHVIAWSWLWVLCPLWLGFVVALAFFAAALLIAAIAAFTAKPNRR